MKNFKKWHFRMGLLILDHCVKDFLEFGLCLVAYIIFMMLLQRLFSSFKYSFSYGEGCLVLQSLTVFCVKSILRLLKFKRIHNMIHDKFRNGILLWKLLWSTERKNCPSEREKLLKFEAEGGEFAKFLRSLEQFIQTVKGQNNFW